MTVSIPWALAGAAAAWVWRKIEKALFYKTYLLSHRRWSNKHGLGAFWEPLGENLEYSLRIAQSTDPEPQQSRVAFRSTRRRIERFQAVFEAEGMGCRYQENVTIHGVDATPIVCALSSLPICEPVGIVGRAMKYSLETVRFHSCVATLEGDRVERISSPLRQSLTQTWAENSHWKERWGIWWNLDCVVTAQQELQIFWRWLGTYSYLGLYSPNATPSPSTMLSRLTAFSRYIGWWWRSIAKVVGLVMGMRWLVIAQFWLAIWSGLFVIAADDRLSWRWSRRSKKHARNDG